MGIAGRQGVRGKGLMVGAVLDQPAGKVLSILRGKGFLQYLLAQGNR